MTAHQPSHNRSFEFVVLLLSAAESIMICTQMRNIAAKRVVQYHTHRRSSLRTSIYCNRYFSSSKKNYDSQDGASSSSLSTRDNKSNIQQLYTSIKSTISPILSEATKTATQSVKQAAADTTEIVTKKATIAKVNAKKAGEQYAWETHRFITKLGENIKQSTKDTAKKTGDNIKQNLLETSEATKNRLKNEISKRIPDIPKLPFATKKNQVPETATAIESKKKVDIPSNKILDSLPSKDQLLQSATHIATETATKTASNVTTQVSEGVHKATRWLWWWGLAAVGVYACTTTLTKEGVQIIKDMLTSKKKEPLSSNSATDNNASTVLSASTGKNDTYSSVNDDSDITGEKKSYGGVRWLSWLPSGANRKDEQ